MLRKPHQVILVVSLALLALGGCSRPATPRQEAPKGEGGQAGNVLRLVTEAPRSLDPLDATSVYESISLNQIFDGLVAFDPSMNVLPRLASTWTISRDGRIYTLDLHEGVRFHDGTPLTAEDVVYTVRRLLSPASGRRNIACSYLAVIEGAEQYLAGKTMDLPGVVATGPLTVKITLKRPYLSFLQVLALDGLKIVPKAVVERVGQKAFSRAPVGTGPFRLESWKPERLRLVANPGYFNGKARLAGVEINFFDPGRDMDAAERFDRREIDLIEVPTEHLDRLSKEPDVRIYRYQELNLAFLGLCSKLPPLDDARVRQAIAHAVSSEALADVFPGTRRAATGILPPGLDGYSPQPKALQYDPDLSRKLLADAGYPGGRGLPVIDVYQGAGNVASRRTSVRLQSDLAAAGIRVNIREVPWSELIWRVEELVAPAFLLGWVADLADPDSFLRTMFETGGASNYFNYADPGTDRLLAEGAGETNPVARAAIYRHVEQRILEAAPIVPLYHPVGLLAARGYVRGLEPSPQGIGGASFAGIWFSEEEPGR